MRNAHRLLTRMRLESRSHHWPEVQNLNLNFTKEESQKRRPQLPSPIFKLKPSNLNKLRGRADIKKRESLIIKSLSSHKNSAINSRVQSPIWNVKHFKEIKLEARPLLKRQVSHHSQTSIAKKTKRIKGIRLQGKKAAPCQRSELKTPERRPMTEFLRIARSQSEGSIMKGSPGSEETPLKIEEPRVSVTVSHQPSLESTHYLNRLDRPTREQRYKKFIQTLREKIAPGQQNLTPRDILIRSKRLFLLNKAKSLKSERAESVDVNGFPKRAHFLGLINQEKFLSKAKYPQKKEEKKGDGIKAELEPKDYLTITSQQFWSNENDRPSSRIKAEVRAKLEHFLYALHLKQKQELKKSQSPKRKRASVGMQTNWEVCEIAPWNLDLPKGSEHNSDQSMLYQHGQHDRSFYYN